MVKAYTAVTHEIDNVEEAVAEILRQLELNQPGRLKKNSVGVLSCFADYLESGVVEELCRQLPFEVLGTTTIANSACGEIGETMLALMVLTSDELQFATGLCEPLNGEEEAPLRACYQQAEAKLPGKPALMLSYAPLLTNIGSDYYIERMSEISGNIPNFGTLAVDHNADYNASRVIFNGQAWPDRLAILLIYGDIAPRFYIGNISEGKVFQEKGVVTGSLGNQLHSVNGMSVLDYLLSLGLKQNEEGAITGINAFPIIVDYNDGTEPVARAMFAITPEGHAVCGGNIPEGSTFSLGSFDPHEIIETTCRTLDSALQNRECGAMLMFSCIGRYFTQGYDQTAELSRVAERMKPVGINYLAAYSGGELCPVYGAGGAPVNRNHNNTFVICAF